MLRLTIVRHARATAPRSEAQDFDRPLTGEGLGQARSMAQRYAARGPKPDVILASPAARAVETAWVFAQAWETAPQVVLDPSLYLAEAGTILEALRRSVHPHVMLVGHNPGASEFARQASRQPSMRDLATAGILHLEFDWPDWQTLDPGTVAPTVLDSVGPPG